ncbi:MAG: hypothetical protein ACM3Q9_02450 [Methanosarcina sp.]
MMGRAIVLYVPAGRHPSIATIDSGSAIVGRPEADRDTVEVYFEGNRYRASNIRTLADRAHHACGRMLENYPTTAKETVPRDALIPVGVFDPEHRRIDLTGPESERAVADWIGAEGLDPAELITSDGRRG